jgi:hypothetical protein
MRGLLRRIERLEQVARATTVDGVEGFVAGMRAFEAGAASRWIGGERWTRARREEFDREVQRGLRDWRRQRLGAVIPISPWLVARWKNLSGGLCFAGWR